MKNLKLAFVNVKKNFQNEKELKSTFITTIIGMFINNIALVVLWYNFGNVVGKLNGWDKFDIIGLYGFNAISFGLVFTFLYGINNIPSYITSGNLDKYLLTPKNTLLKIATSSISTSSLGDLIFGLICYIFFAIFSKFTLIQFIASLLLIVIAAIIFFSFSLICNSISFYLMDGENISSGLFQLFLTPSLYHGGAFSKPLRIVFIFILPSLLVGALPVEIIKNLTLFKITGILLLAVIWLIISILFFYKSLKKYESNNFFGFSG